MKSHPQQDTIIAERAAEWFFALSGANTETQSAFGAWLRESPRHVEEFLLVSAAYKELDTAPLAGTFDVETLRKTLASSVIAHPAAAQALPIQTPPSQIRARYSNRRGWTIAAGVAALAVAVVLGWAPDVFNGGRYSTATGEIRSIELKDGSVVQLNTRSRIDVRFSANERHVRLLAGEAIFKVTRDPARPFRVHTGTTVIQAIGTEFNVYRRDNDTMVSVLEGSVRVTDRELSAGDGRTHAGAEQTLQAGQEARITVSGRITKVSDADTAKTTAWRQRRLVFRGETLAEVADQFNRYNRAPQIRVEGDQASGKPLAGIFDADDPESLLLFLTRLEDLAIDRHENTVVVRAR